MIWLAISLLGASLLLVLSAIVAGRRAKSIRAASQFNKAFFDQANTLLEEQDHLPPEALDFLSLIAKVNVSRISPILLLIARLRGDRAATPAVDPMFRSIEELPPETHRRFLGLMILMLFGLTYRLWIFGPHLRRSLIRGQSPRHPKQPRDRAAQAAKEVAQLQLRHAS